MTLRRFFVEKNNFTNTHIVIEGDEHNHLKNVLRLNENDPIVVVCGDEYDYHATIESVGKNKTIARIDKTEINAHNPQVLVTVFQALTKRDAMSNLVQRLSELGITTFTPLETKNTVAKNAFGKVEKLQVVANQSVKQCKRSIPTKVTEVLTFNKLLTQLKDYELVIFANETENENNSINRIDFNGLNNVAIIVGSEGGFTPQEIKELTSLNNVKSVSLGKRILRVETACIALTALVLNKLNEI